MKALKIAGIVLLTFISLAAIVVVVQSPQSHLERTVIINAPASAIFPYFNNLRNFNEWSPWHQQDSLTVITYEGPESGVGSKGNWVSNHPYVGSGSYWILESEENKRVKAGIQHGRYKGEFFSEVILEPVDEGTRVTYHYDADVSNADVKSAATGKFFSMFINATLGEQYEEGLSDLKAMIECCQKVQGQPADSAKTNY